MTQAKSIQYPAGPNPLFHLGIGALRALWALLTLVLLAIFIAGVPQRLADLTRVCPAEPCPILVLTPPEAAALAELGWTPAGYALFHVGIEIVVVVAYVLLALIIFWRGFNEMIGILSAFALVLFGLNFMVEADTALVAHFPVFAPFLAFVTPLAGVPFLLLFFLFPNGRFVPPWTAIVLVVLVAGSFFDPFFRTLGFAIPSGQFSTIYLWVVLSALIIGVGAQVYRYRHISFPIEKQQTKWVSLGLILICVTILFWSFFIELFPPSPGRMRLFVNLFGRAAVLPFILILPLSFVFSILRYRLWDIDILIRRTLLYAFLSVLLALVYFGSVLVMQRLLEALTGQQSPLGIVLSTLLIAALFNPLRRRLQRLIDRRFYRRRYDATRTLTRFAQTARDEVDAERLAAALLRTIDRTMKPERAALWLKPGDGP